MSAAETDDVALVVVGRRGLGPIDGRLLGSISRRVVELADCPVAVIPAVTGVGAAPPVDGPISGALTDQLPVHRADRP